jgi:nitrogen regulatory protein PII
MKLIIAFIKPHRLSAVTLALHEIKELTGVSVSNVRGFGRERAKNASDSITEDLIDYLPRVRIEIACLDDLVDDVISTIEKNAHTGLRGDGKIYVLNVGEAVRVSSGERGDGAI